MERGELERRRKGGRRERKRKVNWGLAPWLFGRGGINERPLRVNKILRGYRLDGIKQISTSSDGLYSARFQAEEGTPRVSIVDFIQRNLDSTLGMTCIGVRARGGCSPPRLGQNHYCLSNAMYSSIGQNIKSLAVSDV